MPNRPNWRKPAEYTFIENCSPELVAWQFLRRNSEYKQDYHWFITLWNELETQYGKPPNRDFDSWKKDPRAYRSECEIYNLNENTSHDDKLLIECWMGSKWGFYKFPVDPEKDNPVIGKELTWQIILASVNLINEDTITEIATLKLENKTAIIFDLQKNIKDQIQSAKQQLIITQRTKLRLNKTRLQWILYLRIHDAIHEGVSDNDIQNILTITVKQFLHSKQQSLNLINHQYRELINTVI